jgi:Pyruvate/2-oxoacid:ferredoxin oxidoreductase delta subunit
MMAVRKIVNIDEAKCDGCGQCVPSCAEGAIQVIDGKARLVSDVYCDGLGNCLGECPMDAITIEEREAPEFDEEAVRLRLQSEEPPAACPGTMPQALEQCELQDAEGRPLDEKAPPSMLTNWPVQLQLAPAKAPWFDGDLLIAADCSAFTFAGFHERFLKGRALIIGCPKLDSADFYRRKLEQIFLQNDVHSITVVYMEVPCCFGLVHLVHESLKASGKDIPLKLIKVGINGELIDELEPEAAAGE